MRFLPLLSWIHWDPPREAFKIPFIHHPIAWYGISFATGFFVAYLLLQFIFTRTLPQYLIPSKAKDQTESSFIAKNLLDSLTWYVVLGTLVGARLGHVVFYDISYYIAHPLSILKIWEGGLASHGGTVGILIAIAIFYRLRWRPLMPDCSFLSFLDLFCIPVPLAAAFIRLGNFINQEIVGTPSSMPWAVVFGHPYEGGAYPPTPRHPVQLYEALAYFAVFIFLFVSWWRARRPPSPPGQWIGWMFILIFGSRFVLEFWKSSQGYLFDQTLLQTGQLLSLPFILLGLASLWIPRYLKLQ